MAREFLTSLNLNRNELQNARIQNLATDPGGGVEGQVYYNTQSNEMRVYNGTLWEAVGLNGVTANAAEINTLDGITATTAELNVLDGITATTAELNHLDGVTSSVQDQIDTKAPVDNPVFTGTVTVPTSVVFEGATPDDNETTLTVTDPTADRTVTLPDASGTVILDVNTVNDLAAPTEDFSVNSNKITNVATPTADTDAANKAYVDAARSGLDVKQSVRAASSAADGNVDRTGSVATTALDGVTLADGDRVLLKTQTDPAENGIYVYALSGNVFSRSTDADEPAELNAGTFFFVEEGTANGDAGFVLSSDNPLTIGTDDLEFTQFSGAGQIVAGAGLTKTGNTLDAVGTADRIEVTSDAINISSTYVGQASITTIGTIATGTWEATDIAVAHGGTGASTAVDARANIGATTKVTLANSELVPSSGAVTWAVAHALGTKMVLVQLFDLSTGETVEVDIARTDVNTVTLSWVENSTLAADSYQVVIVG
jgi:hypothetical protein